MQSIQIEHYGLDCQDQLLWSRDFLTHINNIEGL